MSINVTRSSMPDFEEYVNEIRDLWDSRWLTNMGSKHIELEERLKEFLGTEYISLFANGHLALEALIASFGFPAGSEVITTPFSFASTTHAIVRNGLAPVFCDIKASDYCMNPEKIEGLITEKTAAILPVHVYGHPCDADAIGRIASRHGLKVIYDAAHTFGESYKGRALSDYGDGAILSFHATKVFHTIEGGAAICHDAKQKEVLDDLKNFGIRDQKTVAYVGGNAKLNEFQAAMGICNLRHIKEETEKRRAAYEEYNRQLAGLDGIKTPSVRTDTVGNYAYYPVLFDGYKYSRDEIYDLLKAEGIGARKYFWPLISDFDCYRGLPHGNTPEADKAAANILTLPLYAGLTREDISRICGIITGK